MFPVYAKVSDPPPPFPYMHRLDKGSLYAYFSIKGDLLEKKVIVKPVVITPRFGAQISVLDTLRNQLYDKLMTLRSQLAAEHSLPPYMVMTEQTVMQLAATLPSNDDSLRFAIN